MKTIKLDDVEYIRADQAPAPVEGTREIIVADNGWVFVGNVTETASVVCLTRCANVRRWEGGFGLLTTDPKKAKALLDPMASLSLRASRIVFRVPVPDGWAL